MSSLKMTFSLTSLILIFALVFSAMPVLAHKITPADNTADSHAVGDSIDPNSHTAHPVVKSVTLLGDAADGYVNDDSYVVEVTFQPASDTNKISVPTGTNTVALESTPAGAVTSTVDTHRINATTYRIRITSSGGTTGTEYTLSVIAGTDTIFTPAAPTTGDDPARAKVAYDSIAPVVAAGTAQPILGEAFPLNNELEDPFDVVFVITDEMASGTDSTAMTLDGTSFMLVAEPDAVDFSNTRYLGANRFAATVTPKAVTADETDATSVTITASVMDKAGNSGVNTAMVTLAARMADDDDDDDADVDPPTATITVSDHMTNGVMATFRVRVTFTPATGGDDVTGFDHEDLTVKDSSTSARTVSVMPANEDGTDDDEGNPHPEPLTGTNRYDGVLEYDTRNEYTYPLKVTINQTALKTHNPMESEDVGMAPPAQPTPDTRAVATLTGTASLEGPFQVTITFDKATTLAENEIMITPAGAGYVDSNSLHPATGSATVFTATIRPTVGAKMITVTVATNTRIKPAATNGSLMESAPIGTLNTITGPTEFDGTTPFIVVFTFEAAPTDFDTSDISVTGGSVTDLTMKTGSMGKAYEAQITPTAGAMSVVIGLSTAGMDKFSYSGTARTVPKKAAPTPTPTPGDITATASADGMTVTLSGTIASNGFAVIGAAALRDLEEFFDIGGTIGLHDADAADGNDKNSREVVISEILWGLDFGATAIANQKQWQFIELYNTTNAAIDLTGWTLKFTEGRPVPKSDVDQVSNRDGAGWIVDIGQSGRVTGTTAAQATNLITPINVVSMYRNINYDKVEKVKADGSADPNRDEQLKGIPGGNGKGSWKASTRRDPATPNGAGITGANAARWIYSSRGQKHYTTTAILTASSVAGSPFRINEIGNDIGSENDWVELHNVSDAEATLKNWALSKVTAKGTDTKIFDFHDKDWKVPAKGFVVISTRHPKDTDLAGGKDISVADDQEENKGASHLFVIRTVDLPDDGKFALILRNAHDKQGGDGHLIDVVATRQGAFADRAIGTSLWPLKATGLPHDNVIDGGDEVFKSGLVYQRNSGNGRGEKQFAVKGYTGVGYDRDALAVAANGGTPGYENGAVKDKIAGLTTGDITISEIMVDTGEGRQNLPQWIELYNSSMTQAVNLAGWKLRLENASPDPNLNTFNATLSLDGMTISPNQTVLIVTTTGRNSDPDHFPSTRLVNIWTTKKHREALEMTRRTDQVISMKGFNLSLVDKDNNAVDAAGNLDGVRRTRDEPAWALPASEDDGRRSSLIRVYDDGVAVTGTMKEAWVSADKTNFAFTISETYYGNPDDFGTPGFRGGGPLPVSLSKFRPERLKDTGEIVVRWITESELNNAGFNILRSEKRDGEFTKVHFEAGKGTTSERQVYEWKDTSAKPNVVYYYQIQDVSLDGDVTTLRVTHLRGNVTAAGKATTTWGEIKALQ